MGALLVGARLRARPPAAADSIAPQAKQQPVQVAPSLQSCPGAETTTVSTSIQTVTDTAKATLRVVCECVPRGSWRGGSPTVAVTKTSVAGSTRPMACVRASCELTHGNETQSTTAHDTARPGVLLRSRAHTRARDHTHRQTHTNTRTQRACTRTPSHTHARTRLATSAPGLGCSLPATSSASCSQ